VSAKVSKTPAISRLIRTDTVSLIAFAASVFTEMVNHAFRLNQALTVDGAETMEKPFILVPYTVITVPTAASWLGGLIYVTDETGGATVAFSDGTNWRRVQDRVVVS